MIGKIRTTVIITEKTTATTIMATTQPLKCLSRHKQKTISNEETLILNSKWYLQ